MRPQVAEGKQHAEGLLHAEEAVERPFPVELDDGEGGGHATGCDDVLARVVTLGGAIPEHQAVEESCDSVSVDIHRAKPEGNPYGWACVAR